MKQERLNTLFLRELSNKQPNKAVLADNLSDLLDMDKISVYRRLREDVRFSVDEIGVIAKDYGISLDSLVYNQVCKVRKAVHLEYIPVTDMNNLDYEILKDWWLTFDKKASRPDSEMGGAMGVLNRSFFVPYEYLTRLLFFKWGRYYTTIEEYKSFHTVILDDRLLELLYREHKSMRKIKKSFFIWNDQILASIVKDIKYYESINQITVEDVTHLKKDLFNMLDELEMLAVNGVYPETGNVFELYSAQMNINTSHIYMQSGDNWNYYLSIFVIREIYTTEPLFCQQMKEWINSQKNSSILISTSGEKERLFFFNRQRATVDML